MNDDTLEPDDERALLNWATDHFGDDYCNNPGLSYPDDGRVVISVTRVETGDRYHMTVIARCDQLYIGDVVIDRKKGGQQ